MKRYVLQVRSGYEISAYQELKKRGLDAVLPRMQEYLRKNGKWEIHEKIVFTQYLFIRLEPDKNIYHEIKKIDGIVRFLGNQSPLSDREQKYIEWLENDGKPITPSKIYVTPGGAKMVLSGILKKYVGNEIDYHLRHRKADIFIPIAGRRHRVTLPIVCI